MNIRLPFRIISAIVVWSALVLQMHLLIVANIKMGLPGIAGVMKFFDYFTLLSNTLVALVFTTVLLQKRRDAGNFFSHPKVKTGIAVYMFITGLTYFFILRHTWNPTGITRVVDTALHYVMPVLYGIEWLFFTPKGSLRWSDPLRWLMFPLVYLLWALFWGAIFGFYPYPFINVAKLGYPQALINSVLIAIGFTVMCLLLVAIDRWLGKNAQPAIDRDLA